MVRTSGGTSPSGAPSSGRVPGGPATGAEQDTGQCGSEPEVNDWELSQSTEPKTTVRTLCQPSLGVPVALSSSVFDIMDRNRDRMMVALTSRRSLDGSDSLLRPPWSTAA